MVRLRSKEINMKYKQKLIFIAVFAMFGALIPYVAEAQLSAVRTITFPVIGHVTYYDDFGNDRSGGRTHEGNDLMGKKMLPLVAAVDGTIINVNYPEESWGMAVTIRDKDGYTYHYLHVNNDNPGTDDGRGDGMNAYAADIQQGNKVVRGQLIGYMGDSGNAEPTQAHLHFEIRQPDRQAYSPYSSLQNATKITSPVTDYPKQEGEILPYENFGGGLSVATGNLDKDTDIEYVTGAGPGGGPLVKAFDDDGDQISSFYAYDSNFRGGVDVAVADVDDDGKAEIITAPGPGGGPHIKIFRINGTLVKDTKAKDFFAYDTTFTGGVFISAADVDDDGIAEIITGAGPGGGPHVKIFKPDGVLLNQFFPYDQNFRGGVDVAAIPSGIATSRSKKIIKGGFVTAPGPGGGPHLKVYDDKAVMTNEFFAYDGNFNLGVRVSSGNANTGNSGMEIGVMPARNGGPHAKVFSRTGSLLYSDFVGFEDWWRGGYDISLYNGGGAIGNVGGRRSSLRQSTFRASNNTDYRRLSW